MAAALSRALPRFWGGVKAPSMAYWVLFQPYAVKVKPPVCSSSQSKSHILRKLRRDGKLLAFQPRSYFREEGRSKGRLQSRPFWSSYSTFGTNETSESYANVGNDRFHSNMVFKEGADVAYPGHQAPVSIPKFREHQIFGDTISWPMILGRKLSSSAVLEKLDLNEIADQDVEAYKRLHEVTTTGKDVPAPYMTFESAGFPSVVLKELQYAGFTYPSPIQAYTWPIALQKRDIVAIAKTGSGKTLGYLLPTILNLKPSRENYRRNPSTLVLAPTRELANQIREEAVKFGRSSRIMSTCICGGAPKGPQLRDIQRGVDIIVATPGRLNDLLEMNAVNLKQVSYLVLDEADRMLDMGFEPQIRAIVDQMSAERQTVMYTATWPREVRRIANDLLMDPVQVNIGNMDELSANRAITQHVEMVSRYNKGRRLEQILGSQESSSRVLIFCSTKRMCDDLALSIGRAFGALAIHGDKSQRERDWVLSQFKTGRASVLVATDVAARGLDIKDIRIVINYDFPNGVEDYVHRIGRTGRAGASGVSYTFFTPEDEKHALDLVKVLERSHQKVSPELRQIATSQMHQNSRGAGNSRWNGGNKRSGQRSSFNRVQNSVSSGKRNWSGDGQRKRAEHGNW